MGGGATPATFLLEGGSSAIALDVHLEDCRVMNEPIDGCERHGGIGEDPVPIAEGLVGEFAIE